MDIQKYELYICFKIGKLKTKSINVMQMFFFKFLFSIIILTSIIKAQHTEPLEVQGKITTTNGPEKPLQDAEVNIHNTVGQLNA